MPDLIERTLNRLGRQLHGRLSMPGDGRYAAAMAIWAKPVGRSPRAVVHCQTPEDSSWRFEPHAIVIFPCQCVVAATTGPVAPYATELFSTSAV
jgi:hypothetical protein